MPFSVLNIERLNMSNIVIIGGSSGIGAATVDLMVKQGHTVWATYNTHEVLSEKAQFFKYDVLTDDLDVDNLPEVIDGLVYCPGSIKLKPFHRFKEEDLIEDYRLQVVGAMKTIKSVYKRLLGSNEASIVLFSTVAVQQGFPFHAQVAASKGAVEGLTRSLAAELAPKIRVNAIAPSLTDTPLAGKLLNSEDKKQNNAERNPMKRIGNPEDIAHTVAFLLGSQSTWITGQIIGVDGGMSTIK